MTRIEPFRIDVPQATLDDLRERLARTRWTDEVEGADWDYGTNLGYLKELTYYWQHEFDWREQEAKLNQFAHFRAEIERLSGRSGGLDGREVPLVERLRW